MATKMFLRTFAGGGGPSSSGGTAESHRGTNNANQAGTNVGWHAALLSTTAGADASVFTTVTTVAGPTAGLEFDDGAGTAANEWVSYPLAADVTISGTVTFNFWAQEASMNANAGMQCRIDREDGSGILTTIVNSEKGTELGFSGSNTVQNWTAAPTSTACKRGDRIRVVVLVNDVGTMGTGFLCTMNFNGPTAAANGDSWVQFTETVTFDTSDPTGTQLFLTTTSAGINPGSATELEMWTSRGSGSTNSATNSSAGWTAGIQITDTGGGTALEWYSRQLTAFTLGGKALVNARALVTTGSSNANSMRAEIAVCASDGTSPTIWGSICLSTITSFDQFGRIGITASSETEQPYSIYVSGPDTSVSDGQRLRLRLYLDEVSDNPLVTGQTLTTTYAGTSAAAAGDSWVTLTNTVTEFTSAGNPPYVNPYPPFLAQ